MIKKIILKFFKLDYQTACDILGLAGYDVKEIELEKWSVRDILSATKYAGSMHLIASDNDIDLPKMPNVLTGCKQFGISDLI